MLSRTAPIEFTIPEQMLILSYRFATVSGIEIDTIRRDS
jgi:hypothetical protein